MSAAHIVALPLLFMHDLSRLRLRQAQATVLRISRKACTGKRTIPFSVLRANFPQISIRGSIYNLKASNCIKFQRAMHVSYWRIFSRLSTSIQSWSASVLSSSRQAIVTISLLSRHIVMSAVFSVVSTRCRRWVR